jgi:hypothetical protein
MSTKNLLLSSSGVGANRLDVEDVFKTFTYNGDGTSSRNIVNGIDLSGEGGLVISRDRGTGSNAQNSNTFFWDTERGVQKHVMSSATSAEQTDTTTVTAFNNNGYTIGNYSVLNTNGEEICSWAFRKAPKFFDVVTYTGTGSAQNISHNLGVVPGMIWVKRRNVAGNWAVFHRELDLGGTPQQKSIPLNLDTTEDTDNGYWNLTLPTSTVFSVGDRPETNNSGDTYVAYLFAHNNSDGDFGPYGDQDIVKCGSFTGNGSTKTITLGFEPQLVLIKNEDLTSTNWTWFDNIRGLNNIKSRALYLNDDANETSADIGTGSVIIPTPTGFILNTNSTYVNHNNSKHIFMAIRRGPLKPPTSVSNFFEIDTLGSTGDADHPAYRTTFPVDFALRKDVGATGNWEALTRLLQGTSLRPNDTNAEDSGSSADQFDYPNGYNSGTITDADKYSWMWRRAPEYFDVVTYTGTGSATTITHTLGVAPEMVWVKRRSDTGNWRVAIPSLSSSNGLLNLESNGAAGSLDDNNFGDSSNNYQTPTATNFGVGTNVATNGSSSTYIAYLFASCSISKVGSYTGDGTTDGSKVIDCGFSAGVKFLMIKRTDSTGNWQIFDTDRGIVAGNDPNVRLDLTGAHEQSIDYIDPDNSGFIVGVGTGSRDVTNVSTATYLFYAIAA